MTYDIEKTRRDNAALRKYAIIQKAQEERVCVQKVYVDMTEDLEAAMVLDELIFFTLPRDGGRSALRIWKDGVLWMAVQRTEWWERKRLKPRQADLAIEKLKEQELVFTSVHKFKGVNTVHIRLNVEAFFKRLSETLEKQNPPENEEDTVQMDLSDLYEMMGSSGLQNGDLEASRLQNGDERLRNGEIINIPHNNPNINNPDSADEIKYGSEEWKARAREELARKDLGSAIIMGIGLSQEEQEAKKLEKEAFDTFERDMKTPNNWTWYPARTSEDKAWKILREHVIKVYAENKKCFQAYQTWRTQPYARGAMSNLAIKRNPENFPASWTDFLASSAMYSKPVEKIDDDNDDFEFKNEIYI